MRTLIGSYSFGTLIMVWTLVHAIAALVSFLFVSTSDSFLTAVCANLELQFAPALAASSNSRFRVQRQAGLVVPTVAPPWQYAGCFT
jgi:hypothetical protein